MKYIQLLLFPFSLLYGLVIAVRHALYDRDWLKRTAVGIPTIVVGNLAVGGTGKSPMVEYLVRTLGSKYRMAVLSRGYGRETKGYREVEVGDDATQVGDEPLQFKRKFPDITVAVCEKRVKGIRKLEANHDLVLLDDAFQHRTLVPGFVILLFDYTATLHEPHVLLPAGNYRDLFGRRKHADVLVVTKTPRDVPAEQKAKIARKLSVDSIPLIYSSIQYDHVLPLDGAVETWRPDAETHVLLVTGIANPAPLVDHAAQHYVPVGHISFPDHHAFTEADAKRITSRFESVSGPNKIVLTTEKDAMRLRAFAGLFRAQGIPVFYVPIRAGFASADERVLRTRLEHYLENA